MNMDFYLFNLVNQFAGQWPVLDSLAVFFADKFGYVLTLALLVFLLKDYKKYLPMVLKAIGSAVFARYLIVAIIRFFWERPRPFSSGDVNLILSHEATGSFPSGHAAFFFALAIVVYFHNKKAGILFFAGAFLLSFARVFSGVHWPSDILAGALVGIVSGWLISKTVKNF